MRRNAIFLLALLSLFSFTALTAGDHHCISIDGISILGDADIEIDDGSVILTNDDYPREKVEITADGELLVNRHKVKTTAEQQELLREYNQLAIDIVDQGMAIGLEGAKVGLEGAKLGLKAVACVFKLLRSDYDEDDLERELEREAAKIEAKADEIEFEAEKIEDLADELEELHEELGDDIPELAELEWWY